MDGITLGQISTGMLFMLGLAVSIKTIYSGFKQGMINILDDKFEGINEKIDALDNRLTTVELASCKNYIVPYLADIERGAMPEELEKKRFWDAYDVYRKDKGNSYITEKVDQLKKEGKL